MKSDDEIVAELRKATAGLLVMSESDYPFEIVKWDGQIPITPAYLRRVSGGLADSMVQESDVDTFLQPSGPFSGLARLLKNNLAELKVYKVGTINIPVYIVGRSAEGNWLGLSTRLVQT